MKPQPKAVRTVRIARTCGLGTTLLEQTSAGVCIWNYSNLDYPATFYNSLRTCFPP